MFDINIDRVVGTGLYCRKLETISKKRFLFKVKTASRIIIWGRCAVNPKVDAIQCVI